MQLLSKKGECNFCQKNVCNYCLRKVSVNSVRIVCAIIVLESGV